MAEMKIKECPHCGGDFGFYRKLVMSYSQYQGFNNEPGCEYRDVDNPETCSVWGGKLAYCTDCNKEIKELRN